MRFLARINIITIFLFVISIVASNAGWVIIDANNGDPVTGQWIGGDGNGVVGHSWETVTTYGGGGAIKWTYTFGASTNNWPTIEILNGNKNWNGATSLGVWMYFDLTSTKTSWTLEPAVMYPYPTGYAFPNWDSGSTGVPNNTWVYHEWTGLDTIGNLNDVSHIRFNYHDGDGWADLAKSNQVTIFLDDITLGMEQPPQSNSLKVFEFEDSNLVTNSWIGGNGQGTQTFSIESSFSKFGSQSQRWRYNLPGSPGSNFPTMEFTIPSNKTIWTGATTLGAWFLFDLSGPKDFWTIQPVLAHPYPTVEDMGNWNVGGFGIPPQQWIWHEWTINSGWDISSVSHLRFYYHAGDGWDGVDIGGNVDIYFDEIWALGAAPLAPIITPISWSVKPTESVVLTASEGTPPYTWSLSTSGMGSLDTTAGNSVTFTASTVLGLVQVIVTDANTLSGTADISITPTSAHLIQELYEVIYQKRYLGELFE